MLNIGKMAVLTVLIAFALSACGLKGDLYLEETPPIESTVESSTESPVEPSMDPAAEAPPAP